MVARQEERASASGTELAFGLLARSRALVAVGDAEPLYLEAIERLGRSGAVPELGRAYLLYGEWLRRERRRRDAREVLRRALEIFASVGAAAFAERARTELRATGERARRRTDETRDELTPHETRLLKLVVDGHSYKSAASELGVTVKKISFHLQQIYGKLQAHSKSEAVAKVLRARIIQ